MEKQTFVDRLNALASQEDILSVSREVNELRAEFEDFCLEEERQQQIAFLEAQERGEEVELDRSPDPVKATFYTIFNEYRDKRAAVSTAKKIEQEANLRLKKNLIERLRTLILEEENIGVAVASYKEIHETWKSIGDIPREKRQDIQSEYSKLLEQFFFNLKIYRELKEHDLRRNFQLKNEVVEKIEALEKQESIKELESAIKALQNEFEETGPVPSDEWETLKERYWTAVKSVYSRIHDFYESKRTELRENIEKKQALLDEVKGFMTTLAATSAKEWDELTQQLLAFQNRWKQIGFGTKKENEELWLAFRQECDTFFARKKDFFDGLRSKYDEVAAAKKKLVERVQAVKDSTEWKQTTDAILRLQQDWKKLGNAGQRMEQVLWKEFRAACDSFFNAKQKHFEDQDKQNEVNLVAKLDIIEKIKSYVLPDDKKQALQALKEFSAAFNAIGKVPFKEKDTVYEAYKQAIDAHYTQLKLEGEEKEKAFFQAKLDTLKASPNADKALDRERREYQMKIEQLKQDIRQYENNLGFFANSKGADSLKKEVESKINAAKRRIDEFKMKLKLLTSE